MTTTLDSRLEGVSKEVLSAALRANRDKWLKGVTADNLRMLAANLNDEQWTVAKRLIENQVPWRSNPALFAHHLTPNDSRPYLLWDHAVLMAETMARAASGELPHQIHMVASQYGKSSALKWFIIWLLDRDPTLRILYVSYSHEKAVEFGGEVRDLIRKYGRHLRFHIRADKRARGLWSTPEGGGLYCAGVDGTITGIPIDVVLCDDLFKGWEAAHSAATREHVWNVYVAQVRMRVQGFTSPIIHVGTRWHEDDIPARLMARAIADPHADQWHVVRLPTFAEVPEPDAYDPLLRMPDPLGRAPGDLLCPERFDFRETMARKAGLASYLWAAMEQQRPAPLEGNIFKRQWWRLDFEDAFSGQADQWITSWDMKLKQKRTGDYVVGQIWARTGKDLWLVDMLRGQWDQPTTENAVALAMIRYPQISRHIMENTGNGPEVMDALRTAFPAYEVSDDVAGSLGMTVSEREAVQALRRRGLPGIIPNNPKGDKTVRALAISNYVEAGDVHICKSKPWFGTFIEEMSNFSGHGDPHDDIVDTLTQAVRWLHRRGRKTRTSGLEQQTVRAGG